MATNMWDRKAEKRSSMNRAARILAADKKLVPGQLYQVLRNPNSPSLSKLDAVLSEAKSTHNGKLEDKISSERRANNQAHSSVEFVQKVAILLGLRK